MDTKQGRGRAPQRGGEAYSCAVFAMQRVLLVVSAVATFGACEDQSLAPSAGLTPDPVFATTTATPLCSPAEAGCPCSPEGYCFSSANQPLVCEAGFCVIDTCPAGTLGCRCLPNGSCSPHDGQLLECTDGLCAPKAPKAPDCKAGSCPPPVSSVRITDDRARACDVLLLDGGRDIEEVNFGEHVIGEFHWRPPKLGIAFIMDSDAPFTGDSVVVVGKGDPGTFEAPLIRCYDKNGQTITHVEVGFVGVPDGVCQVDAHCDDTNPCTEDWCDPVSAQCVIDPAPFDGLACTDGTKCTVADVCQAGTCVGVAIECNDGNPCTDDFCHPVAGCGQALNTDSCDDGNVCTVSDACSLGVCAGTTVGACDDENPCTVDTCDPVAGCDNDPDTSLICSDGSACTENDSCSTGTCAGTAVECSDDSPCTQDGCDPATGCTFEPIDVFCTDGNACTTGDTCVDGKCIGTPSIDCSDTLACTLDSCADGACQFIPLEGWCVIDGECIEEGTEDPQNTCQSCQPAEDPEAWSAIADKCPSTCANGVLDAGETCDDANELSGDGCGSDCQVETGWECVAAGPGSCADIDECALGSAGCDVNATCINVPGGVACVCNAGHVGSGETCAVLDDSSGSEKVNTGDITGIDDVNVSDVQCMVALSLMDDDDPLPACLKTTLADADLNCSGDVDVSDVLLVVSVALEAPWSTVIDMDGDYQHNECDDDDDGDFSPDKCEVAAGTNPYDASEFAGPSCPCLAGGCKAEGNCTVGNAADGTLCNDGSVCSLDDRCLAGACVGDALPCADGNPCTTASCDTVSGCATVDTAGSMNCYTGPAGTAGVGPCVGGTRTCTDGVLSACVGQVVPAFDNTCDGADQDCDGVADEHFPVGEITCGVGACEAAGTASCDNGVATTDCTPLDAPSTDDLTCDDIDNDCNGLTDDGFVSPTQGMWVFSDQVSDAEDRAALLSAATAAGVDVLYVRFESLVVNAQGRQLVDEAAMADFVTAAHAAGLDVFAAYGDSGWPELGCGADAVPLSRIGDVVGYNAAQAASAKVDGVVLDIEPLVADAALLDVFECVRGVVVSAGMDLSVAASGFWDQEVEWPEGGQTQPLYRHVIDMPLRHVLLRVFHDEAGSATCPGPGALCVAEDEIEYADGLGKAGLVLVDLQTADCVALCGPEEVTYFDEGQWWLDLQVEAIHAELMDNVSYGGFALREYGDSYLAGMGAWPSVGLPKLGCASAE